MMEELEASNNEIILKWQAEFVPKINAEKQNLGIKHNRSRKPINSKAKNFRKGGEINRIGISMSKGEVFTHKGVGRNGNRVAKPWFNPIAESSVEQLADEIAANTGDVIGGKLAIR